MAPPSVFKDNPPKRCERVEVGHGTEKELYKAWMTPGSHPRNQRAMFIQTSIVVSQRYRTLFDGSLHCTCGAPLTEFCVGSAFSATVEVWCALTRATPRVGHGLGPSWNALAA